jgi:hypothetical protein
MNKDRWFWEGVIIGIGMALALSEIICMILFTFGVIK